MKEIKRNYGFDRMIIEAAQEGIIFIAWHSIDGIVEECELKILAFKKEFNEIELEPCVGQEKELPRVVSGDRVVNIYIPKLSISFSTSLKSISLNQRIKLEAPEEFCFYERRKHERICPTKTGFIAFEYNKKILRKTIYDVSLGGVAIILPRSDRVTMQKGRTINIFSLELNGKRIRAKVECVNFFVLDRFRFENFPYGGYKLAFKFLEMSEEGKIYILDYLNNEKLMLQVKQVKKKAKHPIFA